MPPIGKLTALITCDEQTGGIGRRNKTWLSQAGNLAATYLLHSEIPWLSASAGLIGLALAASLLHTLRQLLGPDAAFIQLKWPNDLVIGQGKLAGVLVEHTLGGRATLLSAGLNISKQTGAASALGSRYTSLEQRGFTCTAEQILLAWTPVLRGYLQEVFDNGAELAQQIASRELMLGSFVRFTLPGQAPQWGIFSDIDAIGRIGILKDNQKSFFDSHQIFNLEFASSSA